MPLEGRGGGREHLRVEAAAQRAEAAVEGRLGRGRKAHSQGWRLGARNPWCDAHLAERLPSPSRRPGRVVPRHIRLDVDDRRTINQVNPREVQGVAINSLKARQAQTDWVGSIRRPCRENAGAATAEPRDSHL